MNRLKIFMICIFVAILGSCSKGNLLSEKTLSSLNLGGKNVCSNKSAPVIHGVTSQQYMQVGSNDEIEGTYEIIISEDLVKGIEKREHFIYIDNLGTRYKIQNMDSFSNIDVGSKVRVNALVSQAINSGSNLKVDPEIFVENIQILNSPVQLLKNYSLKTLVVMMNFTDRVTTNFYSVAEVKQDIKSIADYYRRVSGNQLNMQTDVDGDGESDVEVVNMGTKLTAAYCTPDLAPYVQDKLVKYKLSDYDTIVYVHTKVRKTDPPQNDGFCPYGGVANIGQLGSGTNGRTHIGVPMISVTRHELGHTFGLGHSGQGNCAYCDQIDPMGNYFGNETSYFNGPKIKQLGLFDNHSHLEHEITSNGVYSISAVGLGVTSSNSTPRLLTIINSAQTSKLYLTYRQPLGEDSKMPASVMNTFKGIVVNTGSINRGGQSSYTKVLKNINDSYSANGMTVKLVAGITDEETEVEVSIDGSTGGPSPSPQPKCQDGVNVVVDSISKRNTHYEVSYSVNNKNDAICGELEYMVAVNSKTFELAEASDFKVAPQSKVSIITKMNLKPGIDLSKITESDGELIGTEKNKKVQDFSISLATKLSGIPNCP